MDEREEDDNKIEVKSDCGDGEALRLVVPVGKERTKIASFSSAHKRSVNYNPIIFNKKQ